MVSIADERVKRGPYSVSYRWTFKPYNTGRYTFSSIAEGELADLQPSGLIGPVRLVEVK